MPAKVSGYPSRRRKADRNSEMVQAVAALKMVERSSDLNQPLQKRPFRLFRPEPHRFPMLVGFEERAGMEAAQAFA